MTGFQPSLSGSTRSFLGFSVSQPFLGAPLQWLPTIGTKELDELINTFLPGPSSIQDKRTHISMDFFEYTRQTGETFKFYAVSSPSFPSVSARSPTDSPLYDSGYGSSYAVSPTVSSANAWVQSPAPFTTSSRTVEKPRTKSRSSASKKSSGTVSQSSGSIDFANHPGMRIMTKDGRDVTNCASRGSKTKEQRDHAHLMRIIKACDACRRKKIRCDPSHKRSNPCQATGVPRSDSKSAKRPKKRAEFPTGTNTFAAGASFDASTTTASIAEDNADSWDQFLDFSQEPLTLDTDYEIPQDYDIIADPHSYFASGDESSGSSSQEFTPFMPFTTPYASAVQGFSANVTQEPVADISSFPYLNPGEPHGTNYIDFNLYSPSSELQDVDSRSPRHRQRVPSPRTRLAALSTSPEAQQCAPASAPGDSASSTGYDAGSESWRVPTSSVEQLDWVISGDLRGHGRLTMPTRSGIAPSTNTSSSPSTGESSSSTSRQDRPVIGIGLDSETDTQPRTRSRRRGFSIARTHEQGSDILVPWDHSEHAVPTSNKKTRAASQSRLSDGLRNTLTSATAPRLGLVSEPERDDVPTQATSMESAITQSQGLLSRRDRGRHTPTHISGESTSRPTISAQGHAQPPTLVPAWDAHAHSLQLQGPLRIASTPLDAKLRRPVSSSPTGSSVQEESANAKRTVVSPSPAATSSGNVLNVGDGKNTARKEALGAAIAVYSVLALGILGFSPLLLSCLCLWYSAGFMHQTMMPILGATFTRLYHLMASSALASLGPPECSTSAEKLATSSVAAFAATQPPGVWRHVPRPPCSVSLQVVNSLLGMGSGTRPLGYLVKGKATHVFDWMVKGCL